MAINDEKTLTSLVQLLIRKPESEGADIVRTLVGLKTHAKLNHTDYPGTIVTRCHDPCPCGAACQYLGMVQTEYNDNSQQECVGLPPTYVTVDEYFQLCLQCGQVRTESYSMKPLTFLDFDLDVLASLKELPSFQKEVLKTIQRAARMRGNIGDYVHPNGGGHVYCGRVDLGFADHYHNFWHLSLHDLEGKHMERHVREHEEKETDLDCPFCGRRT
jgi:hypothetical protein